MPPSPLHFLLVIPEGDLLLSLLLFVFNVVILSEAKDPCICSCRCIAFAVAF
jgi:hypothetical protein